MIWDSGTDDGKDYLKMVDEVRRLVERFEGLNLSKDSKEYKILRKANDVLQNWHIYDDFIKYLYVSLTKMCSSIEWYMRILRTQEVLDSEGRRRKKERKKEWQEDGRDGERSGDQVISGRGSQGGGRGGQGSGRGSQGGGQDDQVIRVVKEVVKVTERMEGNVKTINNGRGSCSYKEFMACNPKDYDGKGGAIVYTRWIEKMELIQDMSGCGENQKVKYTAGSLIAGHAAYTDQFHELARLVPHLVTPENKRIERYIYGLALQIRAMVAATKPTIIQSVILKARMLIDEAIRNGALKKVTEKRGNSGEPSRYGNVRDDNKRSRTRRAFSIITNPVRKEYTGVVPTCQTAIITINLRYLVVCVQTATDSGTLPKIVGLGLG
ncbi:putative reverse transcriptase domain-containing protein [Tanacetum coccineum]